MNQTKVSNAIHALRTLTDDELASVVSSLSADWSERQASTMQAMVYLYSTPATVYRKNKQPIRVQAN